MSSTNKKLEKSVKLLPFDCWSNILEFLGKVKMFRTLILSIPGLYEYVKFQNAYGARNLLFQFTSFPKKGMKFNHVRRIRVGGDSSEFSKQLDERLEKSTRNELVKRLFGYFPRLRCFHIDCRSFEAKSTSTRIHLGEGFDKPFDNLKEVTVLHRGCAELNLYTDNLPNIEVLNIEGGERSGDPRKKHSPQSMISLYAIGEVLDPLKHLKHFKLGFELVSMNPVLATNITSRLITLELENVNIQGLYTEFSKLEVLENLILRRIIHLPKKKEKILPLKISDLPSLRTLVILEGENVLSWNIDFTSFSADRMEVIKLQRVQLESYQNHFERFKSLKELWLDVYCEYEESMKKVHRSQYRKVFSREYETFHHGCFPSSLPFLYVSTGETSQVFSEGLFFGIRNLEIRLVTPIAEGVKGQNDLGGHIFINDDFESAKTTLETLTITQTCNLSTDQVGEWYEFGKNRPAVLYGKGKEVFNKDNFTISEFDVLKELTLRNYCVETLEVSSCKKLKKFHFSLFGDYDIEILHSRSLPDSWKIDNCENLEELELSSNISTFLEIQGCPNIKKLRLEKCFLIPDGLDTSKIEELELVDCFTHTENEVDMYNSVNGRVFPQLKTLKIDVGKGMNNGYNYTEEDEIIKYWGLKNLSKKVNFLRIRSESYVKKDKSLYVYDEENLDRQKEETPPTNALVHITGMIKLRGTEEEKFGGLQDPIKIVIENGIRGHYQIHDTNGKRKINEVYERNAFGTAYPRLGSNGLTKFRDKVNEDYILHSYYVDKSMVFTRLDDFMEFFNRLY